MFNDKCKNPSYVFKYFKEEVEKESKIKGLKPPNKFLILLFAFVPHWIDFHVRLWDFWRNRSYGGRLEKILIKGHSPIAILLPLGLLYFIFFGPSGGHLNEFGVTWILLPSGLLTFFVVLYFNKITNKIESKNSVTEEVSHKKTNKKKISRRLDKLDVVRIFLWSFVTAIVIAGFSRGIFAHIGFFISAIVLWAAFACGSYVDYNQININTRNNKCNFLFRFPWVSGILLIVGFFLFYRYLQPIENEKGTGPSNVLLVYIIFVSLIFIIATVAIIHRAIKKQFYGSFSLFSLWSQLATLTAAGVLVWYFGGQREIDNEIYKHVLIPLSVVMLVIPLSIASVLARTIFYWRFDLIGDKFHRLIELVEVFGSPKRPPLDINKIIRSLFVILRHILMLTFPAALVTLLMPYYLRDTLILNGVIILVITLFLLAFAKIHDRLGHLLSIYQGMFFHGVQVGVSTLVIILGVTRILDIGYVSYIVEASPLTLLTYILVAYLLLWFFEYWINRIFDEELLSLFNTNKIACGKIDYEYDSSTSFRESMLARVKPKKRSIQLHGNGRLVTVGDCHWFKYYPDIDLDSDDFQKIQKMCNEGKENETKLSEYINNIFKEMDTKKREVIKREIQKKNYDDYRQRNGIRFQFYNRFDFLDHLVENAVLSDFTFAKDNNTTGKSQSEVRSDLRWHVKDLRKQYTSYYAMLTMILVFGIVSQIFQLTNIVDPSVQLFSTPVEAISNNATVKQEQNKNIFSLREQIFIKSGDRLASTFGEPEIIPSKKPDPVILIAASGGGTRAALYTASLLQGLAELDLLDNVKLVSGVSGGGAALAYFYGHRHQLLETSRGQPWADFYNAVSKDYIVRCLQGSSERRVAGGIRLGTLLDEGFQDIFFDGKIRTANGKEMGILFNTSVEGEVHSTEATDPDFARWVQNNPDQAKSWTAGTRLIISNLEEAIAFKKDIYDVPRNDLRYISIVNPDLSLATSAALNANFPPVFSNAAVDIGRSRYWVTDGGAMDNRGLISLLYVLKEALAGNSNEQCGAMEIEPGDDQATLIGNKEKDILHGKSQFIYPDIHIIVADASAVTFDYSQKRGFGAILGSSLKLATGLIDELENEVKDEYCKISPGNRIYIHELYMPLTLRARGGLGTHWMMPLMAKFKSCKKENKKDEESIMLTRNQIIRAIAGLHQKDGKDNIGELIIQDPWLVRVMGDDKYLEDIKEWYYDDAAYLRGFTLQGEGIDKTHNKDIVSSHSKAWNMFTISIGINNK